MGRRMGLRRAAFGRGSLGLAVLAIGSVWAGSVVAGEGPAFVPHDCWWEIPDTLPAGTAITCGSVEVPSDPGDPGGAVVTLAVARIHREGADAGAPPILVLHGGPGGNVLASAPTGLAGLAALDERDLIAFDQRGAGRSLPSLECPEKEEAILAALGKAKSWKKEFRKTRKAVKACRKRLVRAGIDLGDFDTPASVEDMESIRQAFGVETWNVFGGSYGSRLGLAYAREHPERVRSLVLDSVYPPEVGSVAHWSGLPQRALDNLFAACAADEACQDGFGDLSALFDQAVRSFDREPEVLETSFTLRGETISQRFVVTGADVRGGYFSALYRTALIPLLPGITEDLAQGNRAIVSAFLGVGVPQLLELSEGAQLSVDCADAQRLLDRKQLKEALRKAKADALVTLGTSMAFCKQWKVDSVPESFNEPVEVDVPTLVLGGTLDPITPYEDSLAQAERMPNARFVGVPRAGHGGAGFSACTLSALNGFWSDPAAELPACIADIEPLPFGAP